MMMHVVGVMDGNSTCKLMFRSW